MIEHQEHPTQPHDIPPAMGEEELNLMRSDAATFLHSWVRHAANERLQDRRVAALALLESFIERMTAKPVTKITGAVVDRVSAGEEVPHPLAALRKSN